MSLTHFLCVESETCASFKILPTDCAAVFVDFGAMLDGASERRGDSRAAVTLPYERDASAASSVSEEGGRVVNARRVRACASPPRYDARYDARRSFVPSESLARRKFF